MKYSIWKNETTETCYIAVPGSDSLRPELICTPYGRYIPLDEAEAEVIVTMLNNQIDQIESIDKMHEKEMARSAYLCEQVDRLEKGIQPEGSNDAVGRAVNVILEKEKEIARLKAEIERLDSVVDTLMADNECLKAENEKLKEGCSAVFDEAAKRKFLTCYPGDLFYVSRKAMETMSEALGYRIKKQ